MSIQNFSQVLSGFRHGENDTGSTEVQIVNLTEHIEKIKKHFKANPKDFSAQRGLIKSVGRRVRYLSYLKKTNLDAYKRLAEALNIRKR